jgi:CBS domain-containing protein
MPTAHEILRSKGAAVHCVRPTDTVLSALGLMAELDIGALLVMNDAKLVGIFSERDYARKVVLAGRSSHDSQVADVMTHVVCVAPYRSLEECMALMTDKRVRHLAVLDHKRVVGVISIGDLVKETIADQRFMITQLQLYIAG